MCALKKMTWSPGSNDLLQTFLTNPSSMYLTPFSDLYASIFSLSKVLSLDSTRYVKISTNDNFWSAVRSFVQPVVTVLKSGKVLSTVFSSAVACRVLPYAFPSSSPPARSPSSVTSFKIPSSQYDSSLPIKTAFLAPDERFTPKHCDNARRVSTFTEINFSSKPVSSSWVQAIPFLEG